MKEMKKNINVLEKSLGSQRKRHSVMKWMERISKSLVVNKSLHKEVGTKDVGIYTIKVFVKKEYRDAFRYRMRHLKGICTRCNKHPVMKKRTYCKKCKRYFKKRKR